MSRPILLPDYSATEFDPEARPTTLAALLAGLEGDIDAPDGVRWFQRDLNELDSRKWAYPLPIRPDKMHCYRLTELGRCVAESFAYEGWTFDGLDVWRGEQVVLPRHAFRRNERTFH